MRWSVFGATALAAWLVAIAQHAVHVSGAPTNSAASSVTLVGTGASAEKIPSTKIPFIFNVGQVVNSADGAKQVVITSNLSQNTDVYAGFATYYGAERFFKCSRNSLSYNMELSVYNIFLKRLGTRIRDKVGAAGHLSLLLDHFWYNHEYYCFVQEKLVGSELGEYLQGELERQDIKNLIPVIKDLLGQVMSTLVLMHRLRVFHLDLKPENIFVILVNGRPYAKVIDYDLAAIGPNPYITQTGTLGYMPAEQFLDMPEDPVLMDVWSAGMSFVNAIRGVRLFCYQVSTRYYYTLKQCATQMRQQSGGWNWKTSAAKFTRGDAEKMINGIPIIYSMLYFNPRLRPTPKQVVDYLAGPRRSLWDPFGWGNRNTVDTKQNPWLKRSYSRAGFSWMNRGLPTSPMAMQPTVPVQA